MKSQSQTHGLDRKVLYQALPNVETVKDKNTTQFYEEEPIRGGVNALLL